MKEKIGKLFKKIPTYSIVIIAIIVSIPLAMNNIKISRDTAKQQSDMEDGEKVLIVANNKYETIISALKEYPEDISEKQMIDSGFIVIKGENFVDNSEKLWTNFCKKVKDKKDAAVLIGQYTIEGDPILQYVSYVDGHYYYVQDATRDQFGGDYEKHDYPLLKRFEKNGAYQVVLTKDKSLTYEKIQEIEDVKDTNLIFQVNR